jgi:hypothetical protein
MCGSQLKPYQYAVMTADSVVRCARKQDAVEAARAWVTSPLRTGPRTATLMRRRGYDGPWETVDTWSQPAKEA